MSAAKMHADAHSLCASLRLQAKIAQLETQFAQRRQKKIIDQAKLSEIHQRREMISVLEEERIRQQIARNQQQINDHSVRLQSAREESTSRSRQKLHVMAEDHARTRSNQESVASFQQQKAEESVRAKEFRVQLAESRRESQKKEVVARKQRASFDKAQTVAANREHLSAFLDSRAVSLRESMESSQRIRQVKNIQAISQRNHENDERRHRAASLKEMCSRYQHAKAEEDLQRYEAARDRLRDIEQKRRQDASVRRSHRIEKETRARLTVQLADTYRERMNDVYLERFEEAKVVGELTRKFQQQRV